MCCLSEVCISAFFIILHLFIHHLRLVSRIRSDDHSKLFLPPSPLSPEAYVPPQLFYNGKVDYFDLQRLGGLLSHLKKTLKGWCVLYSDRFKQEREGHSRVQ